MATQASVVKPPLGAAYKLEDGDTAWPLFTQLGYLESKKKLVAFNVPGHYEHLNEFTLDKAKLKTPKRIPVDVAVSANKHLYRSPRMGTDPEFFIRKIGQKQREPAFRELPSHAQSLRTGASNAWFWDGFQAETTVESDQCHETLASNFGLKLDGLRKLGYEPDLSSIWRVPESVLLTAETEHVSFGCTPSKNIYGTRGAQIDDPRQLKYRFAGGHIHFGLKSEAVKESVKALDAILAVPFVAILDGYDHPIRRKYYGMAGEYREPRWGLEYRTLSNGWLQHPQLFQLATDLARFAFNIGRLGLRKVFLGDERRVQEIINYCDVRGARELFKFNEPLYRAFEERTYEKSGFLLGRAVYQGVRSVLKDWDEGASRNWLDKTGLGYMGTRLWRHL